jgi:capsular exopolysaccharide synthesis family protein
LENLDESVREPQQISDRLGVPLLGAIPVVDDEALSDIEDPKSVLSEAYMTVRTNLGFSTDHGLPRTMALTSTSPSEGKSTSAYSLARVIGRTSGSVVLVDVDMRRPVVATRLGLDNSKGVSNFLAGEDNWEDLIQSIGTSNVSFISAGPVPPSASELLSGDRLASLVRALSERFDHVILDSPPMLGLSDAPLIANVVEGLIYVIEADRTAVRASQAAITRLRESRAQILGALLTKYRARQSGYGYGYGYGYSYGKDAATDGDS